MIYEDGVYKFENLREIDSVADHIEFMVGDKLLVQDTLYIVVEKTLEGTLNSPVMIRYKCEAVGQDDIFRISFDTDTLFSVLPPYPLTLNIESYYNPHATRSTDLRKEEISDETRQQFISLLE